MFTRTSDSYGVESKPDSGGNKPMLKDEATEVADVQKPPSRLVHSPRHDNSVAASKSSDKLQKRASPAEEPDRLSKRQKGDVELRDLEGEVKFSERERSTDTRSADLDKVGNDEHNLYRSVDKPLDRSKDKGNDRYDRDHRERSERPDKSRGDDSLADRSRDKSMERYGRELSVERGQDRVADRSFDRLADKAKDDRSKLRYNDTSAEKSQVDDRFHGQNLPPPPPLPPHMVPQSVTSGRRDEDADRRFGTTRHVQRLSPRHDEKERRRSEENSLVSQDDAKRRKEDDVRERKREEREGLSIKVCISCLLVESILILNLTRDW
jgi:THO complex subunit 2